MKFLNIHDPACICRGTSYYGNERSILFYDIVFFPLYYCVNYRRNIIISK